MKFYAAALALAGLAYAVDVDVSEDSSAVFQQAFLIPDGLDLPVEADSLPHFGPPTGFENTWHPPHPDVVIDGCDSNEHKKWHWVHPMKPKPPVPAKNKWTTSTITKTSTKTVISCPPSLPCPGSKTFYTTVTVPVTTTICPVPVTTPPPPPKTTSVVKPPHPPPSPPKSTTAAPPPPVTKPATTPSPVISSVGTVTKPKPTPTSSRVVVTAAAVPNAQRAGGALAAVAIAAAALI